MRNFGATLFSTIGADSEKINRRRRAMTEVEDLLENDMISNDGRPLANQDRISTPKAKND